MRTGFRLLAGTLLIAASLVTNTAFSAEATAPPETVVRAFNDAISAQRLDAALATLAQGAVKFNFGSAHQFSGAPGATEPLTSDLAALWRTVAPVLHSANKRYRREVISATTHVDGPLATVWAQVRTTTEARGGKRSTLEFAESYILRLADGEWRIAGVANARPTR
ncbi:MAG: hypothetical protein CMLOHMNK_01850 [Steroidobacteraceae bacterium]|nr:hypothetical protein [Steroidobacteraceae bacterium]